MKQVRVQGVLISEIEPDLLVIDYGTNLLTPDLFESVVAKLVCEWGDRPVASLVKAQAATDLARVSRVQERGELDNITLAVAILMPNAVMRVLGNLYIKMVSTGYPIRLFDGEEAAVAWLRGLTSAKNKQSASAQTG